MLQQSRTHADQSQHQETLERTLGGNVGNAGSRTQSSVPVWILNGMRLQLEGKARDTQTRSLFAARPSTPTG